MAENNIQKTREEVANKNAEVAAKKTIKEISTTKTTAQKKREENLKKAVATSNANKFILNDLLAKVAPSISRGNGAKGLQVDVFRKEVFADCLPDEKKIIRRKLRKVRDGLILSFRAAKSFTEKEKIAKSFWDFYSNVYTVNDFSVNSLCGGKTDENTRAVFEKVLPELKKTLKK